MSKPTMWFPNSSNTNQAVQAWKIARSCKFRIKKVEELYYTCSKYKGADQLHSNCEADQRLVTVKLICAFVFAYADRWYSHEAAHSYFLIMFVIAKLQMYRKVLQTNFWNIVSSRILLNLIASPFKCGSP